MNSKNILTGLSMVLLAVFVVLGAVQVANNNKLGTAGLLDSLGGGVKQNKSSNSKRPAASGRITAVDGDTITVQGTITTTYKIDASAAKITKTLGKNTQDISASDIKPGDIVQIFGTVSDNPISVTSITDTGGPSDHFSFSGNVASVNGNSFTIERQGSGADTTGVSYTINTISSTVFMKDGKESSISDVVAGEMVMVNGTVDQTSKTIAATNVNINTHSVEPNTAGTSKK